MHLFYVVWDYTDERFFEKLNASDCSQFTSLLGFPPDSMSYECDLAERLKLDSLGVHMDPLFYACIRRSHLCGDHCLEENDRRDVRRRVSNTDLTSPSK